MIIGDFMLIISAFGIGLLLSLIHFGGLWLTVRTLPRCVRPRMFFWASYLGRYAITLWGFAQVMKFGGLALASAFLGFYLLRTFMLSRVGRISMFEMYNFKGTAWK